MPNAQNTTKSNNPQIIRDVLRELINEEFNGDIRLAASEMSDKALLRLNRKRRYKRLTEHMLYNILSDKSQIKFSQLEIVSGYLGVPVGLFLFFTRLKSAKRDNNAAEQSYLRAVHTLFGDAFAEDNLSVNFLIEISSGSRQLDLGLVNN